MKNLLKNLLVSSIFVTLLIGNYLYAMGGINPHIKRAMFTTQVENREPINNISQLDTQYRKVYYYTEIVDCKGCKVEHEWWHQGTMIGSLNTTPTSTRWRWWSYKSLNGEPGRWTVITKINGKQVYSETLNYYTPTEQQLKQAPIQQRLELRQMSECEEKLFPSPFPGPFLPGRKRRYPGRWLYFPGL